MTEASETKRAPVQYISFDFQITEDKEEKQSGTAIDEVISQMCKTVLNITDL